jgi:hypothetical protein
MRKLPAFVCVTVIAFASNAGLFAAGDPEIAPTPLGTAALKAGSNEVSYRLPRDVRGPLPQAMVLIASQPVLIEKATTTASAPTPEPASGAPKQPVPATLKFSCAGRQLPPWELTTAPTAYVLNLQTLRGNPEYAKGRVALTVDMQSQAESLSFAALGMPDPCLLDDSHDGPLAGFAELATDAEVRAYLSGLTKELGGQSAEAKAEYEKLRNAKNERVARLARRGMRMLSYDLRRFKLSGNFMEHYRWGLYLEQCGLFGPAFAEFEECRIITANNADGQFKAAEMLDRQGVEPIEVLYYLERSREDRRRQPVTDFYMLFVLQKSREGRALTNDEISQVRNNWLYVEKLILAASRGNIRIWTSFFQVDDERKQPYKKYAGLVLGPGEDIIQRRGWFDGVISVTPRVQGEEGQSVATVGADVGPRGAALSAVFHDSAWPEYLRAFNQQLASALAGSEAPLMPPLVEEAVGCGIPPIPHEGYGLRAALRYYVPAATWRRAKIADVPAGGVSAQLWKIEGPYGVDGPAPADGLPGRHVLDAIPAGAAPKTVQWVNETDFVDLAAVFPEAGWARAQATCWVFSPRDQEVRMWLGRNDGIAAWLNGRCVYEGRRYAGGNFEDRNLTDTVAAWGELKRGWNEVRVVVESWPAPRDKGWGFSLRFSTPAGRHMPGLAYVNERPEADLVPPYVAPQAGRYYSWAEVQDDWYELLPRLTPADLQTISGVRGLTLEGTIQKGLGYVAFNAAGQAATSGYRAVPSPWDVSRDRDFVLNNVLDWSRESIAAYRYAKDGKPHDLLLVRPEAIEAYLLLLNEPAAAASVFEKTRPADRMLGYAVAPGSDCDVPLLVVDVLLSEGADWPADEQDVLTPISTEYIPNRPQAKQAGPQTAEPEITSPDQPQP